MYLSPLLGAFLLISQGNASGPPITSAMCLECHSDPQLMKTTEDGAQIPLKVDPEQLKQSVHAKLTCVECHSKFAEIPHASGTYRSRRELSLAYDEQCRRCHFTTYAKTLDSVHQAAVARGDRMAPVCVDCHGAHDIRKPSRPRTQISATCAKCHAGVAAAYDKSVHGRALGSRDEADVPVCTDCHRSHAIGGPHEAKWELATAEMCGGCHADEKRMKKYGLSTAVLRTYLADFHGKTASLRQRQGTEATGPVVAKCTDCHGVHDIGKVQDPASPVIKANLQQTCSRCHADANANFPATWLSHYEPGFKHAPIVYGVKLAYAALIPFMIGGLGLQILLHLWRLVVNR